MKADRAYYLKESLTISLGIHALLLLLLFVFIMHHKLPSFERLKTASVLPATVIMLDPTAQEKQQEKQNPEKQAPPDSDALKVDAPGVPNGLAVSLAKLPDYQELLHKKPGLKTTKNSPQTTAPAQPPKPLKKLPAQSQSDTVTVAPTPQQTIPEELQKEQSLKKTALSTFFDTSDKKTAVAVSQKTPQETFPEKKMPSLADLFKSVEGLVHASTQQDYRSEGQDEMPSGDIVISQGSLKYYSLWTKFLDHLNNAAHFNRRGKAATIMSWFKEGKINQEFLCAIDTDKQGNVIRVTVLSSSGHKPFDQLCTEDIWSATPFPPLPDSFPQSTARFEVKAFF